jgi:heat shock protein HtpX
MHNLKVFVLLAGLTALFVALGGAVGGSTGALVMAGVSAVMNFAMYWGSSSMVLRAYGARVVTEADAPELYRMVDRLRQRAGLPMPTGGRRARRRSPTRSPRGRNPEHAVVCVTEGLLGVMRGEELEGVVAHELAHIKNRDMLLSTVAATMAGAISAIANVIQWGALFGGHAATTRTGTRRRRSRRPWSPHRGDGHPDGHQPQREFKADASGAEINRPPARARARAAHARGGAHRIPMHPSKPADRPRLHR